MFITKTSLPRRTFMRGMGTVLALPLLDAMVPAASALAHAKACALHPSIRRGLPHLERRALHHAQHN